MRPDLVTTLAAQLWNQAPQAYRAAMREHGLTEDELTALDRQIMDLTLAYNDAMRQPTAVPTSEQLPASLEELAPTGEINPSTGRRTRQIVLDLVVTKADSVAFDLPAMQVRYREVLGEEGRFQSRERLLAQIAHHVQQACPDLTAPAQQAQVRLTANAVFAGTGQRPLP